MQAQTKAAPAINRVKDFTNLPELQTNLTSNIMPYSTCPVCGVNFNVVKEMLESPAWEDRITARIIIDGCRIHNKGVTPCV